jgi:2-oxoglutarate dehydrogenase complex dehydrogenase (E1) component-like enzyme
MKDVSTISKWFPHDQFKPENQVKHVYAHASEPPDTSKLHQEVQKYPNVDEINWTKDVPKNMKEARTFYQTESCSSCQLK